MAWHTVSGSYHYYIKRLLWNYKCCQQICRVSIWERESWVLYGPDRKNSETTFSSVLGKANEQSEPYERRKICVKKLLLLVDSGARYIPAVQRGHVLGVAERRPKARKKACCSLLIHGHCFSRKCVIVTIIIDHFQCSTRLVNKGTSNQNPSNKPLG